MINEYETTTIDDRPSKKKTDVFFLYCTHDFDIIYEYHVVYAYHVRKERIK